MAAVCLVVLALGLLLETFGLGAVITEDNSGGVFRSRRAAAAVLRRQRRYNTGLLEEVHRDNLERECREETCNFEEAREVFENDEKTLEFWASYTDGDQCKTAPCQNGAFCKDGINAYVCYCKPEFSGKNCEIEFAKQCFVNNGGCAHFCVVRNKRALCFCAHGYSLAADRKSCEPAEPFSCGHVSTTINPKSFKRTLPGGDVDFNPNDTLQYEDFNLSAVLNYKDYSFLLNDSDPLTSDPLTSTASGLSVEVHPGNSTGAQQADALGDDVIGRAGVSVAGEEAGLPYSSFFPTRATITVQDNPFQRVVGGSEVIPGEIPWQVTLMTVNKNVSFCGGSLLSEMWVITAAHCLLESKLAKTDYFVRVGEHDLTRLEGHERDHAVAEEVVHPSYDDGMSKFNNDIALLRLSSPVELSDRRRPICLGPKAFTEKLLLQGGTSLVSGWGRLKHQGLEATRLQKVEVPYVDQTTCKKSSRDHVTRSMFCAGYDVVQKDSCQGDSGGPHATNYGGTWFLTGIVSWGEDCAKEGKYGIYTRVSGYYHWVTQVTGLRSTSAQ